MCCLWSDPRKFWKYISSHKPGVKRVIAPICVGELIADEACEMLGAYFEAINKVGQQVLEEPSCSKKKIKAPFVSVQKVIRTAKESNSNRLQKC